MRNIHQRTNADTNLTIHLHRNRGCWVSVKDGIMLRIEANEDGSATVYNGAGAEFVVEQMLPSKLILSSKAGSVPEYMRPRTPREEQS